jgi:cytochrome bd-type quinol oxidase subunit 1
MFMIPFPYIANTAGWYTAELGRQPWLVYNLMRMVDGVPYRIFWKYIIYLSRLRRFIHSFGFVISDVSLEDH